MNNQQALTRIWEHFITNKGRFSITGDSEEDLIPRYRGDEGARCPVGLIMDKRDYDEDNENISIDAIYDQIPSLQEVDVELLLAMQLAHDNSATDWKAGVKRQKDARMDFKHGLIKIAKKFGLVIPRNNGKRRQTNNEVPV